MKKALTGLVEKPKTQRGKRFLENRASKIIENTKTAMFIRGNTASEIGMKCLKDICSLKRPSAVLYGRKNDLRPFEDIVPVEFFAKKSDASLFLFTSSNKKRPHNLVMGRMYDQHLLDMIELGLENYRELQEFKVSKISKGVKPCLIFNGEAFDDTEDYKRLKSLLIDFFRGEEVESISLSGLEHVLVFTAIDSKIFIRSYKIMMKKSGSRVPRIELEEIGPSLDLVLRRTKLASNDLYKKSTRQPKQLKVKKVKNIKKNPFGTQVGQIHMQKQNLNKLQTRKLKALKKSTTKSEK